ncbi:MAG: cobalamin-binding protein [Anaerolineales bacterium]|jgi:iron complex transport system substrate-binding protein
MFRKSRLTFLAVALLLTACATVRTDGLSRSVKLQGTPRRIVSLAPSNTEILFAVGAGKQVVGRDSFSDYPTEAKSIKDIGGSMGKYDTEAIVALHPDLVLAGEINTPELVNSLQQLGLTVYYLPNPTMLEAMYANLETVGQLTGHQSEAVALVNSLKLRVAAVDAKIKPLNSSPTVYYELDATDPTKPYTAGPGTFVDLLISRAGGINIGKSLASPWPQISLEKLLVSNPAVIILGDSAYGTTADSVKQRSGWGGLAAVQTERIYPFDDNLVSRPGPRLVEGLETLAKLLHPDVFK